MNAFDKIKHEYNYLHNGLAIMNTDVFLTLQLFVCF